MFKKSIYLLILFLTLICHNSYSQNSQVLYYMNLPQSHILNPALTPTNTFYLGVPGITSVNINVNNNFVKFSDVIMPGQRGDSLITFLHPDYNVDNFIKKLKNINFISPEINIQVLGMGFKAGKDLYISLDVTERIQANFALPKDLFVLALKGNDGFLGKTIDLSGLDGRLRYYHEFGLGVSKNVGSKLRVGVRGKLLFGVANFSTRNKSFGLTVNSDYSYDFNADLSASISGPVKVYMGTDNKPDSIIFDDKSISKPSFFANTKNMGLALDLGAIYQLTDKISVSGSITDLGYINWKDNVTNLKANSTFKFSGFNITDVANGSKTFDQLASAMADSLKNSFTVTSDIRGFTTMLPLGLTFGGCYNLTKNFSFGLLSHSIVYGKQLREALTLSANMNLGNALSASISYSAENRRYDNLGAGLAFRLGVFQLYFIADNIPVSWNRINSNGSSFLMPYSMNTLNLRLGMNLAFGNKVKKKTDKPMLSGKPQIVK
jgi:hypothetical protein